MNRIYLPTDFDLSSALSIVNDGIEVIQISDDVKLALDFYDNLDDYSNYNNIPSESKYVSYVDGVFNKALHLTSKYGKIRYDNQIVDMDKDKPFSLVFWARNSVSGNWQYLFSTYNGSRGVYLGVPSTSDSITFVMKSDTGSISLTYSYDFLATTDYAHFAITYDGSGDYANGLKLYVDNVDVTSSATITDTSAGTPFGNSAPTYIGQTRSNSNGWQGDLDDFGIFSKALTPQEVSGAYNGMLGLFKATAKKKNNITYFKDWFDALEGADNIDVSYTLLEDDDKEYIWDGSALVETDGYTRNNITELNSYITSRTINNIRPIVYFYFTGSNTPRFESMTFDYNPLASKVFTLTEDDNTAQKQTFYKDEKKLIQINYTNTTVKDATDIDVSMVKDNNTVKEWKLQNMIFDSDDNNSFYFKLDLTGIDKGSYNLVITVTKGDDFIDIAKNITLKII